MRPRVLGRSMGAVRHFPRPTVRRTRRMMSPFLKGSSTRAARFARISHLQTDRQTKPFRSVPSTSAVTRRSPTLMSFFLRFPFSTQTASFQRTTSPTMNFSPQGDDAEQPRQRAWDVRRTGERDGAAGEAVAAYDAALTVFVPAREDYYTGICRANRDRTLARLTERKG